MRELSLNSLICLISSFSTHSTHRRYISRITMVISFYGSCKTKATQWNWYERKIIFHFCSVYKSARIDHHSMNCICFMTRHINDAKDEEEKGSENINIVRANDCEVKVSFCLSFRHSISRKNLCFAYCLRYIYF